MTDQNDEMMWEEDDGMEQYRQRAEEAHEESVERFDQSPEEAVLSKIYGEKDLVKRASKLAAAQLIDWPHMKMVGDGMEVPNPRSDANRYAFLEALFDNCSGRVKHPYFDLFSAQALDHNGVAINERTSHANVIVKAMDRAGLRMQSFTQVDECYKRLANSAQRNSLLDHFNENVDEWDGVERLETAMLELFRLKDTELNRKVCKYFWLSFYNRIVDAGSYAPLSIALIGAQNVGKSFFSVMLCRTLMGNKKASPAALNLSDIERNLNDWLRRITGNSIIANIGELRGYKKTDIETFKEFTTRTVDNLNQKWGSPIDVPRQWVIIADANSYEGFNRDETGNRRFYPLFVNQGEDKDGQPWWPTAEEDDWRCDFTGFDITVWKLMAECRAWMNKNGENGYNDLVNEVSKGVAEFSHQELHTGRGIIKDETMEAAVKQIIVGVQMTKVEGSKYKGFFISNSDMLMAWNATQRGTLNNSSLLRTMRIFGWTKENISGLGRGWFFLIDRQGSKSNNIGQATEGSVRFAAYSMKAAWESDFIEHCQTDKIYNTFRKRVKKKIDPEDGDNF